MMTRPVSLWVVLTHSRFQDGEDCRLTMQPLSPPRVIFMDHNGSTSEDCTTPRRAAEGRQREAVVYRCEYGASRLRRPRPCAVFSLHRHRCRRLVRCAGGRKDRGDKKQARKARRDARRPEAAAPAPLPTREEMAAVNARPVDTRRTWVLISCCCRFHILVSIAFAVCSDRHCASSPTPDALGVHRLSRHLLCEPRMIDA